MKLIESDVESIIKKIPNLSNSNECYDTKNLGNEYWLDILGFEGLYKVSNLGRIKSLPRRFSDGRNNFTIERIMRPSVNNSGYLCINLCKNGKPHPKLLHRIVANAFIENPLKLPCVNHKDLNKHNNTVINLEWCTHKQNTRHALENGRFDCLFGESSRASKLTKGKVEIIRNYFLNDIKGNKEICEEFSISNGTLWSVITNKTWKNDEYMQILKERSPSFKRHRYGERNGNSKFSKRDVLAIRDLYENFSFSHGEIAKLFGVNKSSVSSIINYKIWTNI